MTRREQEHPIVTRGWRSSRVQGARAPEDHANPMVTTRLRQASPKLPTHLSTGKTLLRHDQSVSAQPRAANTSSSSRRGQRGRAPPSRRAPAPGGSPSVPVGHRRPLLLVTAGSSDGVSVDLLAHRERNSRGSPGHMLRAHWPPPDDALRRAELSTAMTTNATAAYHPETRDESRDVVVLPLASCATCGDSELRHHRQRGSTGSATPTTRQTSTSSNPPSSADTTTMLTLTCVLNVSVAGASAGLPPQPHRPRGSSYAQIVARRMARPLLRLTPDPSRRPMLTRWSGARGLLPGCHGSG